MVFLEQGLRWRDPGHQAERPRTPSPGAARVALPESHRRQLSGLCARGQRAQISAERPSGAEARTLPGPQRRPFSQTLGRRRAPAALVTPSQTGLFHRAPRAASKRREVALSRELESGRSCGHVQTPGSCWALSVRPDDAGGGPVEAPRLSPQYAPISGEQPPPLPAVTALRSVASSPRFLAVTDLSPLLQRAGGLREGSVLRGTRDHFCHDPKVRHSLAASEPHLCVSPKFWVMSLAPFAL